MRRHSFRLSQGLNIEKETRRYDAANDKTFSLRSKEEDIDYRFLVDPDLPKYYISNKRIKTIK